MSRKTDLFAIVALLSVGSVTYAQPATPKTGTPITGALAGNPGQKTLGLPPDGNLLVTLNVQLLLGKLNPLATKDGLVCYGVVDDLQTVQGDAAVNTVGDPISTTEAFNALCEADFAAIVQRHTSPGLAGASAVGSNGLPVWLVTQSVTFPITNGTYQGIQTVQFTMTPAQFLARDTSTQSLGFLAWCQLQLGDNSGLKLAKTDSSVHVPIPPSANVNLIMLGRYYLVVAQPLQFTQL